MKIPMVSRMRWESLRLLR